MPINMHLNKVSATINLKHLRHNLLRVKELAPDCKVVSVIKANAYGHGLFFVAEALHESDSFAVARFEEALLLRRHLSNKKIDKTIFILEGVSSIEEYDQCLAQNMIPIIHCLEQFKNLLCFFNRQKLNRPVHRKLSYWLKVDTGMHRLGLLEDDFKFLLEQLKLLNPKYLPSGILSHFSCADEKENPVNHKQLIQFKRFCSELSGIEKRVEINKSMANSAAILAMPESYFDWVRPGIMLYGVSPFETAKEMRSGLDEQLKPVMTLSSELIAIQQLKKGDCIGYGAQWCCPEDMTIGVIAIGYGDGYPRHAEAGTPVLIQGIEVPLIGRVSMDMISVDLRALEKQSADINIGDKVILWGHGLPIEKISQKSGTIAYELLCQITQRVSFKYE